MYVEDGRMTSLCQQNVENTMPTYVQGTVMPDMSDLMNRKRDSGTIGILLRFHASLEYGFSGCVSIVGIALHTVISKPYALGVNIKNLPWVVECTSAPYSISTVSCGD
jgi:hypothetical protein